MRSWPDQVIEAFQEAGVDYDDVCDLEGYDLFKAYMDAIGKGDWAEHLWDVFDWVNEKPAEGDPMPEHLGQVADEYKRVSGIRLDMDKEVAKVKARETELKNHLIDNIDADSEAGVMGRNYQAIIKTNYRPRMDAEYWPQFYAFVAENDRFDLLQKRLSDTAVMELLNAGEEVPGVERMTVKDVSIRKVK
jgi:hypothetical protein